MDEECRPLRKLRIACSSLLLVVLAVLVVLWARSYERADWTKWNGYTLVSVLGEIGVTNVSNTAYIGASPNEPLDVGEYPYSTVNRTAYPRVTGRLMPFKARFRFTSTKAAWYFGAPYWFLTVCAAALSAAAWFKPSRRFTLRTLLIAMTIVAVGLGLAIFATRK